MVMDLPRPTACSLALLDAVIAERQGGANAAFFNGLASEWRERVRAYIERAGSPEFVPRWPQIAPRKRPFLNLYLSRQQGNSENVRLGKVSVCKCAMRGLPSIYKKKNDD